MNDDLIRAPTVGRMAPPRVEYELVGAGHSATPRRCCNGREAAVCRMRAGSRPRGDPAS
jgi:hypothetical protein